MMMARAWTDGGWMKEKGRTGCFSVGRYVLSTCVNLDIFRRQLINNIGRTSPWSGTKTRNNKSGVVVFLATNNERD